MTAFQDQDQDRVTPVSMRLETKTKARGQQHFTLLVGGPVDGDHVTGRRPRLAERPGCCRHGDVNIIILEDAVATWSSVVAGTRRRRRGSLTTSTSSFAAQLLTYPAELESLDALLPPSLEHVGPGCRNCRNRLYWDRSYSPPNCGRSYSPPSWDRSYNRANFDRSYNPLNWNRSYSPPNRRRSYKVVQPS